MTGFIFSVGLLVCSFPMLLAAKSSEILPESYRLIDLSDKVFDPLRTFGRDKSAVYSFMKAVYGQAPSELTPQQKLLYKPVADAFYFRSEDAFFEEINDLKKFLPTIDTFERLALLDMSSTHHNRGFRIMHEDLISGKFGAEAIVWFAPLAASVDLQYVDPSAIDDHQIKIITDGLKAKYRTIILPRGHRCAKEILQTNFCGDL